MSRNRRHQTAAARFGTPLKALTLCLFFAGSGLGYVWQKEQINKLGQRLEQAEIRYEKLRRDNDKLARVLETLKTPEEIEARIRETGLGLVAPTPDQIVRLVEVMPTPDVSGRADQKLLASQPFRVWAQQ